MQQQQPSNIRWERLALHAPMLAARILGPKCRASAEESVLQFCSDHTNRQVKGSIERLTDPFAVMTGSYSPWMC